MIAYFGYVLCDLDKNCCYSYYTDCDHDINFSLFVRFLLFIIFAFLAGYFYVNDDNNIFDYFTNIDFLGWNAFINLSINLSC